MFFVIPFCDYSKRFNQFIEARVEDWNFILYSIIWTGCILFSLFHIIWSDWFLQFMLHRSDEIYLEICNLYHDVDE